MTMTPRLAAACLVLVARVASAQPAIESDSVLSLEAPASTNETSLVQLIADTPDSEVEEKSEYYFRLGQLYASRQRAAHASGDANAAKVSLLKAVKTFKALTDNDAFRNYPKMDTALFAYGYTLQTGRYMKEARAVYDKLLKNYPNSKYVPEAHLAFADYYFEAAQLADAEARYKMVLKFPKSRVYWYAMYKLGWIHLQLQRYQEALETFFQVAQATKNDRAQEALNREAKRDFVRAYVEIGKADKAHAAFQRVDAAYANDMLALAADLYARAQKLDAAALLYRQLATLDPERATTVDPQVKEAAARGALVRWASAL